MSDISISQRIKNAAASQEVENVKARHTYLHGRADASGEWANIWSRSDECSWAHAFGRMRGFDQVWYGSVAQYDSMEASVHTLVTDIIEVASDGKSARGSFITPGLIHSALTPEKQKYCNVLWERYGSDFVLEDGRWVYLHEQVCPDILTHLDCLNWAFEDYARLTDPKKPEAPNPTMGEPPVTDKGPLHHPYSVLQKPQDTVPWPKEYDTLDDENTYTPFR